MGAGLRPTLFYLGLAVLVIAAGLTLRLVSLGLPAVIVKYGGSVLWAAMVYLLLAACLPRSPKLAVTGTAAGFATLVELSRLYHQPALDAFRLTKAGILLLGRVFSGWHLVIYWAVVALLAWGDWSLLQRRRISVGR